MIEFLAEQLAPLGTIRIKRMFGAECLFLNGNMLGIYQNDQIFIKKLVIDNNDIRFSYLRKGKEIYLNYVLIDNELIDEQDELLALIQSFLKE